MHPIQTTLFTSLSMQVAASATRHGHEEKARVIKDLVDSFLDGLPVEALPDTWFLPTEVSRLIFWTIMVSKVLGTYDDEAVLRSVLSALGAVAEPG